MSEIDNINRSIQNINSSSSECSGNEYKNYK